MTVRPPVDIYDIRVRSCLPEDIIEITQGSQNSNDKLRPSYIDGVIQAIS